MSRTELASADAGVKLVVVGDDGSIADLCRLGVCDVSIEGGAMVMRRKGLLELAGLGFRNCGLGI
jgi:hypothetical protein